MNRIKLEIVKDHDQFAIYNVNNDFIGRLAKSEKAENSWLFAGEYFFKKITPDNKSIFWIDGTYEQAIEKINMLVDKYINRFLEKE